MTHAIEPAVAPARGADCWKQIGVRGDRSCPKLAEHVHCRNCPVYGASAAGLLERELPPGYERQWSEHFARPKPLVAREASSVLVFRIGPEWLALATASVAEIAQPRPIHSLPHRKSPVVLGLANVRGELLVCVSLASLLGVDAAPEDRHRGVYPRLLVLQGEGGRLALPVNEVHGIHRLERRELEPVPTSVARARATYTREIFAWQGRSVGRLDERLLLYGLGRSLG